MMAAGKKLTDEQMAVVEAALTSPCLLVNSLAGTGKSATALACVRENLRRNRAMRIGYLCFNSANAREMRERAFNIGLGNSRLSVSTLHGLAWRDYGRLFDMRRKDLINPKPWHIREICDFAAKGGRRLKFEFQRNYARRLALDCLSAFCHSAHASIQDFFDSPMNLKIINGIDELELDAGRFRKEVEKLWFLFTEKEDFPGSHDTYLKMFQIGLEKQDRFDLLVVDEAQDLFPVTEDMVRKLGKRLLLLGDRYQQIYAWNSSVNSMQHFDEEADLLYLTKSFRCPENVVREAEKYLRLLGFKKRFRASDNARESGNAAIICRSNSGLFINLAEAMKNLEPAEIWMPGSRDPGRFRMIRDCVNWKLKRYGEITFKALLYLKTDEEWLAYSKETRDVEMELALEAVNLLKVEKAAKLLELIDAGAFSGSPANARICLTTAHSAKGLEFGAVNIFRDFSNISELEMSRDEREKMFEHIKREMTPEDVELVDNLPYVPCFFDVEELRLAYVALTRSHDKLEPGMLGLSGKEMWDVIGRIGRNYVVLLDRDSKGNRVFFDRNRIANAFCQK